QVVDVVAQGCNPLSCRLLPHEVCDEEANQELALDRCELNRGLRPGAKRLDPFRGQRVDGSLTRLPRLLPGLEVAELGEALRLDVVLALPGPGEHPAALRHAEQVVRTRATASDEPEDLVRKEGQVALD